MASDVPEAAPAPELAQILNLFARAGGGATAAVPLPERRCAGFAPVVATTYQIAVDEVLYFQSDDKYTIVYTANGEHVIRMPLAELVSPHSTPEYFWQVHRGTIVNIRNVLSSKRDGDGRSGSMSGTSQSRSPPSRAYQHLFKQM